MPNILEIFETFLDSRLFIVLQILGGLLSLFFVVAIVVLIHKGGAFERHIKHLWIAWRATPIPKHRMVKRWLKIKKEMEGDDPTAWRTAIIDADSMLDEVVSKLGYRGNTLEERLENIIPEQFPSLDDAWRAHQISDFLKEDSSYDLTREVAERTIDIYRDIFLEVGIIL